ncbi:hypothetical protein Pmani_021419 [Petrolisthes manimaculis]|uniref:Uncharacterized protein n=1 Tax=Petrolisthes manimaculis TaxID=1843537 RepID=A0AAE1PE59_9EUCA|nr:hypothetical protein Pmani_021419 [Petrolisthes manimaculis]
MCTDKKERGVKHMILAPPSDLRLLLALLPHHHYQSLPLLPPLNIFLMIWLWMSRGPLVSNTAALRR